MNKFITLVFVAAFTTIRVYGQSDSLRVFVKIAGPKRERFKIYYKGILRMSTPKGGAFLNSFNVNVAPSWEKSERLDFYITKNAFFGLFDKYVGIGIPYDPRYKYLVIYRDASRKNKYPITYYWSNELPAIAR